MQYRTATDSNGNRIYLGALVRQLRYKVGSDLRFDHIATDCFRVKDLYSRGRYGLMAIIQHEDGTVMAVRADQTILM